MNWNQLLSKAQRKGVSLLREWASDLSLLADTTQLNRRTRMAWQMGRTSRAYYLVADHQRRRIARRRAIRRLVEGSADR